MLVATAIDEPVQQVGLRGCGEPVVVFAHKRMSWKGPSSGATHEKLTATPFPTSPLPQYMAAQAGCAFKNVATFAPFDVSVPAANGCPAAAFALLCADALVGGALLH